MDVQKLKNNLEKRKNKRDKIKENQKPYEGSEESDSALDILSQAELNGVKAEIRHLERKINKYED
jgi:hypothetical protein